MANTDTISKCLNTARTVISEGISYWNAPGYDRRRQDEHEKLIECGFRIRDLYNTGELDITAEEHEMRRGEIEVAKLVLAAADYDARGASGSLASQYPQDVLERMIQVDNFRQYDVYDADEDELQQRIQSQDSQLYDLVRDEIAPQLEALNEGLTGTSSELNKFQMRGLKAIYGDRLETLHQATALYIRHHGLPNVVEALEDAVLETADASTDRERIVAELEASLSESMEEVSTSLHNSLRDQRHQLENELHRLTYDNEPSGESELSDLLDRLESLIEQQADQQTAITEQIRRRESKLDELEQHIDRLEGRLEEESLEESVEQLIDNELKQLRNEQNRLTRQIDSLEVERKELETAYEQLETERNALSRGELPDRDSEAVGPVYASEARIAEFDYSTRFETAVYDLPEITLTNGDSFSADEQYWRDHHQRTDERQRMKKLLEEHTNSEQTDIMTLLGQHPLNRHSKFVVERSGRLSLMASKELTIELRMSAHLETFARYGVDDRPATRQDLLEIMNDVIRNAEQNSTPSVVAVASPTGWTDAVERTIERGEGIGTQFSRQVDVILVDLYNRTLTYNDASGVISSNIGLFEFPSIAEKTQECVETIQSQFDFENKTYIVASTISEETEFREHIVASAFAHLEDNGIGTRQQTARGLVLDLRGQS